MGHNVPAHSPGFDGKTCLCHCAGLMGETTPQAIHAETEKPSLTLLSLPLNDLQRTLLDTLLVLLFDPAISLIKAVPQWLEIKF